MNTDTHPLRKYFEPKEPMPEPAPNKAQPRKADAASHSPLPWGTVVETEFEPCAICDTDGNEMVHLVGGLLGERATNAKLIVRAVNNADKLAGALRNALNMIDPFVWNKSKEAAILDEYEKESQ